MKLGLGLYRSLLTIEAETREQLIEVEQNRHRDALRSLADVNDRAPITGDSQ